MSADLGDRLLQRVKARCEAWADWYSREQTYGLGYPSTSPEYRWLRGGVRGYVSTLPIHEAAEEIERWVMDMGCHYPQMAQVLRCHYLESGSLRQGAKRLGISHTYFRSQLVLAHHWLAGKLSLAGG